MKAIHIEAKKEEISEIVIMPGDPLRAKYIVEKYFDDYKLINSVRNILGFTGHYRGKLLTVMASGMGLSSMGIYAYELYNFFNVQRIIRVGSCGSYQDHLKLKDLILVQKSYTDSNYAKVFNGKNVQVARASSKLNQCIKKQASTTGIKLHEGNIHSTDIFYNETPAFWNFANKHRCLAAEMESFSLFYLAKKYHKEAACLLTVSDLLKKDEHLSKEEREKSFDEMIQLALNSCL